MAKNQLEITLADDTTLTVKPNLFDTAAFERYLRNNPKLGTVQQNTLTLQAFRAWHAAKRQGLTTMTWEEFSTGDNAALMVVPADEHDDDGDDDELQVAGLGLDTNPAP